MFNKPSKSVEQLLQISAIGSVEKLETFTNTHTYPSTNEETQQKCKDEKNDGTR